MSYVALYRQYRPKTFDEVAGQKVIVQTLKNAIVQNKIAHAYLFSGPRGTGKTSIAKIFAKAVNCTNNTNGNPCQSCDVCTGIDEGYVTDIIEIDAASNNGVDEIRELRDKVKYMPSVGKYKVYIIDEVHMLSTGAFNALLKTLEEPPSHVIFILATTEIHKIPATVLSRCQRFDFKNIEDKDMFDKLEEIIKTEKIDITKEAIKSIIVQAEGGLRDALSLLDQAVSFTKGKIEADDIALVSGSVSTKQMETLLNSIIDKDYAVTTKTLDELFVEGKEAAKIVSDMILTLRDNLVSNVLKNDNGAITPKLTKDRIYQYIDFLTELQNDLKFTQQKRVYMEITFMKMINHKDVYELDQQIAIDSLKMEIDDLRRKLNQRPVVTTTTSQVVEVTKKPLVDIKMVLDIMHNANRDKRISMQGAWHTLGNYPNKTLAIAASRLHKGELVAVSDKMLLVYDDINACKQVLNETIKESALQIFNSKTKLIDDYTAILRKDWNYLSNEFIKNGNKLNIDSYDFGLYEEVALNNENMEEEVDEIVQMAIDFFGEDKVKVKED